MKVAIRVMTKKFFSDLLWQKMNFLICIKILKMGVGGVRNVRWCKRFFENFQKSLSILMQH